MPCAAPGCSWARQDPWRRPDRRPPGQALGRWPVEHASTIDRPRNGGAGSPRKACVAASPGSRGAHYRPFLAVLQTHQVPVSFAAPQTYQACVAPITGQSSIMSPLEDIARLEALLSRGRRYFLTVRGGAPRVCRLVVGSSPPYSAEHTHPQEAPCLRSPSNSPMPSTIPMMNSDMD
jgi:hypothetical protein